jgi:hypothetical protein
VVGDPAVGWSRIAFNPGDDLRLGSPVELEVLPPELFS